MPPDRRSPCPCPIRAREADLPRPDNRDAYQAKINRCVCRTCARDAVVRHYFSDHEGRAGYLYGIDANRAALDAVLRYHHEQGLTPRRMTLEEVFVTELLDT